MRTLKLQVQISVDGYIAVFHGPEKNRLKLVTAQSYNCGMAVLKYVPEKYE